LHDPTQTLTLSMRAKMDADRLWHQHKFVTMDLTTAPPFLKQDWPTPYEKCVALELMAFWKNTIIRKLLEGTDYQTENMFTNDYRTLRQWHDHLEQQMQLLHVALKQIEKENRGMATTSNAAPKGHKAPAPYRNPPKKSNKPPTTRPIGQEPNAGFHSSTKITPFRASEASMTGTIRLAATATQPGVKHHVMAAQSAAQPANSPAPTQEQTAGTVHTAPSHPHPTIQPPTSHLHPPGNAAHMNSQYATSSPYTTSGMVPAGHVSRYSTAPHGQMQQAGAMQGRGHVQQPRPSNGRVQMSHPVPSNGHGQKPHSGATNRHAQMPQLGASQAHIQIPYPAPQVYGTSTFRRGGAIPIPFMPDLNSAMEVGETCEKVCEEGGEGEGKDVGGEGEKEHRPFELRVL
jgi:hypothetical protein